MKFTIELTDAEWEKLNALAESRTRMSKTQFTPELCIKGFIAACVTNGGGWKNPSQAAQEHIARKRAEEEVEKAAKKARKKRRKARKKAKAKKAKPST